MDILLLDQIFPFVVFGAGLVLLVFFELPYFQKVARERMGPDLLQYWKRQNIMAWCFFWVGGVWTLQKLLQSM